MRKENFIQNAIKNANLSNAEMSRAQYYQASRGKKIMCFYTDEIWRDITEDIVPNIQPWYLISNYGRVYSKATNSIVKQTVINSGYCRVQLYGKDNNKIDLLIHRLVALVFIHNDDPINKVEVNHKDTNEFNNRVDNLEWVTQEFNLALEFQNENDNTFTNEEIETICKCFENGITDYRWICLNVLKCKYTGYIHRRLWRIHKRKHYTAISNKYNF